jgi:glycosyltransferase involved in cell wall biosynthesis
MNSTPETKIGEGNAQIDRRKGLISICIPTCNRPDFLRQAVESCLSQKYRPLEILIGDDSGGTVSGAMIASLPAASEVEIRYRHNARRAGQARNINALFASAKGERLILLHDDDRLCDDAITTLTNAWDAHPGCLCVYGMQYVIDETGRILPKRTRTWNRTYHRIPEEAGPQPVPLVAALRQQMPNNSYLVSSARAHAMGFRSEDEVGDCVDADFGIRLGETADPHAFVFVDKFVSEYRLTSNSIARSDLINRRQDLFYDSVRAVRGGKEICAARDALLARVAVGATVDAALAGRKWMALRILFSRPYRLPLLSRWTVFRLACIGSPRIALTLRRRLRPYFLVRSAPDVTLEDS